MQKIYFHKTSFSYIFKRNRSLFKYLLLKIYKKKFLVSSNPDKNLQTTLDLLYFCCLVLSESSLLGSQQLGPCLETAPMTQQFQPFAAQWSKGWKKFKITLFILWQFWVWGKHMVNTFS